MGQTYETEKVIESVTDGLEGVEAYDTEAFIKNLYLWKDSRVDLYLYKAAWHLDHLINHILNNGKEQS